MEREAIKSDWNNPSQSGLLARVTERENKKSDTLEIEVPGQPLLKTGQEILRKSKDDHGAGRPGCVCYPSEAGEMMFNEMMQREPEETMIDAGLS
jgi:hypothetical protein